MPNCAAAVLDSKLTVPLDLHLPTNTRYRYSERDLLLTSSSVASFRVEHIPDHSVLFEL
ncbi:hypothetical protein CC2G_009272 [Coprinopsis cinerea AmutBmut pab1-1]|nr:hypothetical protein CC2G_009272 [Coprinopsis cinerea AmutBmut pab1-1]